MRGGSEIVYFNTARLLEQHGHKVAFFSTRDPKNEPAEYEKYFISVGNIRELSLLNKIKRVPSYLYNFEAKKNLEKLISDFKPDVAHVHIFYGVLSVSILKTLKKFKIPVVHTVHDYRLLCPVNTLIDNQGEVCELCRDRHFVHCIRKKCSDGNLAQSFMVTMEAYFWKYFMDPVRLIDHFVFVSNFSKRKHLEFNDRFSRKFTQIYNFTHFSDNPDFQAKKGGYFLYFGRLSVEKGVRTLITAFKEKQSCCLKIAGTGPMKEFVENAALTSQNIDYVGFKKGKDLEELIRNASFVILPSECYENNPLSIIEAYCFRKPVIGANIAGIPELIRNGVNGFLFDPGDKASLEQAIDLSLKVNGKEYESFSGSVSEFANLNFNPERHFLSLMKVFSDVIGKGGAE